MSDLLLLILSIIGFFALYWVLIGQWRWNKQMREVEMRKIAKEIKEKAKKGKKK
ncbi:hypothetical protein J4209_01720 [Candidatus Woesearchaeota archaeon]|nr:hypothetical protein [Candidatus Woesearchaeota archaeon]